MELATISMDRNKARKAFLDYRRAVRERHNEEDAEIMRGYRVLARGQQLIRLSDTLRRGGTALHTFSVFRGEVTMRLPNLGVARADAKWLYSTGIGRDGEWQTTLKPMWDLHTNNRRDRLGFPAGTFEPETEHPASWGGREARAMVPIVPPPLRPAHKLSGYHVLFEAEWGLSPAPPGDPALLKRISGDFFAVVAVWELTEIEKAVLAGRTIEG